MNWIRFRIFLKIFYYFICFQNVFFNQSTPQFKVIIIFAYAYVLLNLFESKKIKDAQLPAFIASYMKRKGIDMEPKATAMLADFVGSDLSRLTGELEKLIIAFISFHSIRSHRLVRYQ